MLAESIRAHGHKDVFFTENPDAALLYLKKVLKPGDVLITQGAGDVWKIGEAFLKSVKC